MNLSWILILCVLALPLIYFFVEKQKNRKENSEKRMQVQRKEALDAILKNNKDRYQA